MHSRQRQADDGPGRAVLRTLGLACACLLFALRAFAVPAAPGSLLATPASARVTLTWSAVTGVASYNVYRSLTPGGPYGAPLAGGLTAATYTDNAASNDTTYYYVATAVDGTGEGPHSAEDPATPRAGTFVSGIIGNASGQVTTTWNLIGSPYVVVGEEVRGNQNTGNDRTSTLIIQPGVRSPLRAGDRPFLRGRHRRIVSGHSGRLLATGATFTSNLATPAVGDWKGIRFGDTATDGATNNFLDGCAVEWAETARAAGASPDAAEVDAALGTRTPVLVLAARAGNPEIVEALLAAGAAVDARIESARPPSDRTALMAAAAAGHAEVVRTPLRAGADPKLKDRSFVEGSIGNTTVAWEDRPRRATALILAAERGHVETVEALLKGGADVNGRGAGTLPTPLLAAIEGLQPAVVRVLLLAGTDVEAATREETPLSLAVANGSREIAEALLAAGADPNHKASESPSPLEIARLSQYDDLVELLVQAGARVDLQVFRG